MRNAWSALHGGYDADDSVVLRAWLATMHAMARPLAARGVSPAAVTGAGVVLAIGSVGVVRRSPATAALLVVGSVVLDGLDGAVAVATGRVSDRGALLDTASDRVVDGCLGATLGRAGGLRPVASAAAVSPLAFEVVRARLTDNRRRGVGRVTAGDRPARVGIVLGALLLAATDRKHAKLAATAGAAMVVGACVAGAVQLRQATHELGAPKRTSRAQHV